MKKFKKVSILKPDHLGDLVLSMPAIRQIELQSEVVNLFVGPATLFLAKYLFPTINVGLVSLSYLSKNGESEDFQDFVKSAQQSDVVVFLRNDDYILKNISALIKAPQVHLENSYFVHETEIQRRALVEIFGDYRPMDFFVKRTATEKKKRPRVGLVISAGFLNNSLSIWQWTQIGNSLIDKIGAEIHIIAGPAELKSATILQKIFKNSSDKLIIGTSKVEAFLSELQDLDWVVSTDSGTAHIVSLAGVPQISIFGPSPEQRYRPLGARNIVLSREFNCSPCAQFEPLKVNTCLSRECLAGDWSGEVLHNAQKFNFVNEFTS